MSTLIHKRAGPVKGERVSLEECSGMSKNILFLDLHSSHAGLLFCSTYYSTLCFSFLYVYYISQLQRSSNEERAYWDGRLNPHLTGIYNLPEMVSYLTALQESLLSTHTEPPPFLPRLCLLASAFIHLYLPPTLLLGPIFHPGPLRQAQLHLPRALPLHPLPLPPKLFIGINKDEKQRPMVTEAGQAGKRRRKALVWKRQSICTSFG
jgi:hypothetical protein